MSPALAQGDVQQQQQITNQIANDLGQLHIQVASSRAEIAALQEELKKAQARVKELEAKYEPEKKDAKQKP